MALYQFLSLTTNGRGPREVLQSTGTYGALDRLPHSRRLLRDSFTLNQWLLAALGTTTVVALLYAITFQRSGAFADPYKHLAVVTVLLMAIIYRSAGVYSAVSNEGAGLLRLTRAWLVTVACLVALGVVTDTGAVYSRRGFIYWTVAALFAQYAINLLAFGALKLWQEQLNINLPTVVIGSGPLARHLVHAINHNPLVPEHVVGVLEDPTSTERWSMRDVPVLGSPEDIDAVLRQQTIDRVYIALPLDRSADVARLLSKLLDHNVDVVWCPDIFAFNLLNHSVREMAGIPLISLSESPLISGGRAYLKSLMDVVFALLLLIAVSPIMLLAAIAIRTTSPGPIFYRQPRHGWDSAVFTVWKFRTMVVHQEGAGAVTQATADDQRVTRVGRFLRATSLDELPQLLNVLNGTMSLVGPRPHATAHNADYSKEIAHYMCRHRIKPGITGLAQIHGHRGLTDTLDKMQARVACDIEYINNWSLALDLWILLMTPYSLLKHRAF